MIRIQPSNSIKLRNYPKLLQSMCLLLLLCIGSLYLFTHPHISHAIELEDKIKVAYLFNFFRFIQWPSTNQTEDQSELYLCVLGKDQFGDELNTLDGRTANSRKLHVVRIQQDAPKTKCHIIYISQSQQQQLQTILGSYQQQQVLTVSDIPKFAHSGGMIGFVLIKGKMRFEVNLDLAKKEGLKISSTLLELAKIVR